MQRRATQPLATANIDDALYVDELQQKRKKRRAQEPQRTRAAAPASAVLECVEGPEEGEVLELSEGQFTIGRARDNDMVLKDIAASRKHLELIVDGDVVVMRDLASGNGTRVNGKRAKERTLLDGDEITIGNSVIAFRAGLVAPPAPKRRKKRPTPPLSPEEQGARTLPRVRPPEPAARTLPRAVPPPPPAATIPPPLSHPSTPQGARVERRGSPLPMPVMLGIGVFAAAVLIIVAVLLFGGGGKAPAQNGEFDMLTDTAMWAARNGDFDRARQLKASASRIAPDTRVAVGQLKSLEALIKTAETADRAVREADAQRYGEALDIIATAVVLDDPHRAWQAMRSSIESNKRNWQYVYGVQARTTFQNFLTKGDGLSAAEVIAAMQRRGVDASIVSQARRQLEALQVAPAPQPVAAPIPQPAPQPQPTPQPQPAPQPVAQPAPRPVVRRAPKPRPKPRRVRRPKPRPAGMSQDEASRAFKNALREFRRDDEAACAQIARLRKKAPAGSWRDKAKSFYDRKCR